MSSYRVVECMSQFSCRKSTFVYTNLTKKPQIYRTKTWKYWHFSQHFETVCLLAQLATYLVVIAT